ncbi:26S proteasome non-ATPase regulatory subunit 3 [Nosema bombycis CQ1]|uniref:26S proteasome non-ATPase regulatory subunit 3 n=1 Tax=Nosema bombycis (strain CQ1 / CVCC 102059) TaxID=578461 RepID=R0MIR2_NOSB1|nr:26S proteasome non-ATPase regulatory subunit 3 [Nosema bombycis CQ1]|eukprot:EOB14075.1 26S proteasome non-ATPase regulatory subunit 3 [Nosema bombycis CQ1]
MENKHLEDLKDILDELEVNTEQGMDYFDRKYKKLVKNITEEEIHSIQPRNKMQVVALNTIFVGILFTKKSYETLVEYVEENLIEIISGYTRKYDSFVAKIIKSYYASRKICKLDSSILFSLMVPNKEKGNEETISVLTNCILDMLIQNKIYVRMENKITTTGEQAKYNYYNGVIEMVEMNYDKALEFFHHASILSKNKNLSETIEKNIILCMLLKSEFNIPYAFSKRLRVYFEIIKTVKDADMKGFEFVLEKNKEDLMKDNLYFIAQRLSQNVVQEGIRKIAFVYSRISYKDIANSLKMEVENVDFILKKTINQGLIRGRVENETFFSLPYSDKMHSLDGLVKDGLYLTKYIRDQMKYPKIEPLCYEKISK